ncbi:unnamed protein product [Plutella xylostella]|uniref:(diamondback moth) hypothetical protein n=1 Tax=Plutella xylostella TaxID=51655 RepID=A0A8S4E5X9_PLUXY|nr:unnamed protein product [Plutella xylostella]
MKLKHHFVYLYIEIQNRFSNHINSIVHCIFFPGEKLVQLVKIKNFSKHTLRLGRIFNKAAERLRSCAGLKVITANSNTLKYKITE